MKANKTLEFLWSPSEAKGEGYNVFTHLLEDSYCQPMGSYVYPAPNHVTSLVGLISKQNLL